MRADAARSLAACSTAWWTSCAGTSTVSLTLSSPSCSTVFAIGEPLNQTVYRQRAVDVGARDPQPQDAQAVRRASRSTRRPSRELARACALRAEPPPDPAVALPRARAGDAGAGSSERCGEKEAVKLRRAPTLVLATAQLSGDAHDRRGGSARDRLRRLRRAARGDRARPRVLLAHAGRLRRAGGPGGASARRRRAGRGADPPRAEGHRAAGEGTRRRSTTCSASCRKTVSDTQMRARGVEPPRTEAHRDLSPARLPVPPRPRAGSA